MEGTTNRFVFCKFPELIIKTQSVNVALTVGILLILPLKQVIFIARL